jgi:hypothetical protein
LGTSISLTFQEHISSFYGKKRNIEVFGGGYEVILFGNQINQGVRIQTIEYIDGE